MDWDMNLSLLRATLRSVLAQTSSDFRVLVACHEPPEIEEVSDRRVDLLECKNPIPDNFHEQMKDKGYKRKRMMVELRRRGGGYFMLLDSDDLVSRRLVEFVQGALASNGHLISSGYRYDASINRIEFLTDFHKACGSSCVLRLDADDLPVSMDDHPLASSENSRRTSHSKTMPSVSEDLSTRFPFPRRCTLRATAKIIPGGNQIRTLSRDGGD